MRFLIVLLSVIVAAPGLLTQSPGPALAGLDAEFAGKSFTTKIPVGIHYVYSFQSQYQYQQFNGQLMQRRVETRVSADGRIYYVAVGMHYPLQSGGLQLSNTEEVVIKPEEMIQPSAFAWVRAGERLPDQRRNVAIPPGTKVYVSKWRWGSDKVSLELSVGLGVPTITFIFGKGFQSSATQESILSVISRALILEDFENLQRAEAEYPDLKRRLDAARSAYASAIDSERLKAGDELLVRLRAMAQNRSTKEQLTRGGSASESVQFTREAADLEPILRQLRADLEASQRRLEEEGRIKRVEEIGAILKGKDQQIDSLLAQVQARKASGLADWREREARLAQVRRLLEEKAPLHDERAGLGQAQSGNEVARHTQQEQRLESMRAALESQRAALERRQVDEDYRGLDRKLTVQRNIYSLAFGTPTFAVEANRYLVLLQQMYDNRLQAGKNGSPTAPVQAATLLKEMERTRLQLRRSP
jgi:hypothetical protein